MPTIPDVTVADDWVDVKAAADTNAAAAGVPPLGAKFVLCAKAATLLVHFGPDKPGPMVRDGEPMVRFEKLVIENEPNVWVRTWDRQRATTVHLANEL